MSCSITGSGSGYVPGKIVTGSEALSLHLLNDTTDVTTAIAQPGLSNYFTIWMTIQDGGSYPVFSNQYGCWGYFVRTGLITDTYEAEIVENSSRVVEIILRCNNFSFGTTINGVSSAAVSLRIRVEDGKQGVFLGWHSVPSISVGPLSVLGDARNNENNRGERELGTGSGSVVVWSSGNDNFVSRHPSWGQKPEWAVAEAELGGPISNRAAWCGIDDATYGIWGSVAIAPTQFDGYPNSQFRAPWWVADIYDNGAYPLCRYIVMRKPIETGVWQFNPLHTGSLVCHFCNEWVSPFHASGVFPFQIFIGAFKYVADTSNGYANEPTSTVREEVVRRVNRLEWPGEPPRVWLNDNNDPPHGNPPRLYVPWWKRRRRYV